MFMYAIRLNMRGRGLSPQGATSDSSSVIMKTKARCTVTINPTRSPIYRGIKKEQHEEIAKT